MRRTTSKYLLLILLLASCTKKTATEEKNFVIDGDSIAFGLGSTNGGYGPYLHKQFPDLSYANISISGQDILTMCLKRYVDTVLSSTKQNILLVDEVINDLYHTQSGDSAFVHYKRYCYDTKKKFPNTIILLVTPSPGYINIAPKVEDYRQRFLTLIRADFKTSTQYENIYKSTNDYADVLVDVGGDKTIGLAGNQLNTIYFFDQIHHTDSGYIYRGKIIENAIRLVR